MSDIKLVWHGAAVMAIYERQLKANLMKAALDLQSESVKQAPKDTGDLRGNCAVDDSNLEKFEVTVGYSLPYALRQHEELNYKHTNGKAKYLEDPFNLKKSIYMKFIGSNLK